MKYKTFSPVVISAVILAACNNSSGPKTAISGPAKFNIPASAGVQTQQQGELLTDTTKLPGVMTPTVAPVITTTPTTGKAGLNPEHGQPGHRCDIAVGAPLDSKPAITTPTITQTNATPVTINPQPSLDIQKTAVSTPTVTTTPATTTSKAGLNPEHGKPGHRCDIAVGAPLDSKPTTITSTPTTNTNTPAVSSIPAYNPITTPIKTDVPVKTEGTVTAPGMNPEHGKPGHRCDIAVGAPLDSKPSTPQTITVEKKN